MKRTRTITLLLIITALLAALCSCTAAEDPFDADTTENINAETEYPGDEKPDPAFFSLTEEESFAAYGLPASSTLNEDVCDGRYIYSAPPKIGAGTAVTVTRREYPDGTEWEPVCSDPLCTHTEESGCPLAKCKLFCFVCFENKIFFHTNTSPEEVYVYEPQTNKSTLLADGLYDCELLKLGDKLYIKYSKENVDLSSSFVFCRIFGDGTVKTIGELNERFSKSGEIPIVYEDRYVTDERFEMIDGEIKSCLYLRDLQSGTAEEVFSKSYPDLPDPKNATASSFELYPLMLYGDRVLFKIEYSELLMKDAPETHYGIEYHLFDLKTRKDRAIITSDDQDSASDILIYSSKTIIYTDPVQAENGRLVINCIDPFEGEEISYDITKAAEAAEMTVPEIRKLSTVQNGALIISTEYSLNDHGEIAVIPWKAIAYDMRSGTIFKYREPALEELAEKYAAMYGM